MCQKAMTREQNQFVPLRVPWAREQIGHFLQDYYTNFTE